MAAPSEVVLSSEISGQMWNSCVWDPHNGTSLKTYKGGSSSSRTLRLLGQDHLIAGVSNHPLIHVWALHRQDQHQMRIVCPGLVTALDTSPCGSYCAAGIAERIHLWHVSTGKLLAVLSRHYQNITCLKFTDDGGHLISGGDDSLVLVWSMASILQRQSSVTTGIEPLYVWSSHSLPITDIHCGCAGIMSRVVSASLDQTCRLWELSSGQLGVTFIFDVSITSVTMDTAEFRLFAGGINGTIYQVNLYSQAQNSSQVTVSESGDNDSLQTFERHKKQVTCLSVSMDGTMLLSGSHDCTVVLWDIASRQCTRVLNHKGIITNAMFIQAPVKMFESYNKTITPIQPFQRNIQTLDDDNTGIVQLRLKQIRDFEDNMEIDGTSVKHDKLQDCLHEIDDVGGKNISQLQKEVSQLQDSNKKLFTLSVKKMLETST
ncbi:WD repeat-containing protein 18-like [Glandiceps talaboti]